MLEAGQFGQIKLRLVKGVDFTMLTRFATEFFGKGQFRVNRATIRD
jgi:hypothetical protein